MNSYTAKVAEFHRATCSPILDKPKIPTKSRCDLRVELLREEVEELAQAIKDNSIEGVADALADIQYILSGTVLEFGMQNIEEECFNEVHRSNMSKFCEFTHEARASVNKYMDKGIEAFYSKVGNLHVIYRSVDKKILKGVKFFNPNLIAIIRAERKKFKEENATD